jgi:hypothetical protein
MTALVTAGPPVFSPETLETSGAVEISPLFLPKRVTPVTSYTQSPRHTRRIAADLGEDGVEKQAENAKGDPRCICR